MSHWAAMNIREQVLKLVLFNLVPLAFAIAGGKGDGDEGAAYGFAVGWGIQAFFIIVCAIVAFIFGFQ